MCLWKSSDNTVQAHSTELAAAVSVDVTYPLQVLVFSANTHASWGALHWLPRSTPNLLTELIKNPFEAFSVNEYAIFAKQSN